MAEDNNKVIISRIQNRRGLKQDLPQPLRPGEIGFAMDTQQVFIGSDPDFAGTDNKTSIFETTIGAKSTTISIANNNIIAFTVPFKKFGKGSLSTITKEWLLSDIKQTGSTDPVFRANMRSIATATPNSNVTSNQILMNAALDANISVGDLVTGTGVPSNTIVVDVYSGNNTVEFSSNIAASTSNNLTFTANNIVSLANTSFIASDIIVYKNDTLLLGDSSNATPSATTDYSFSANALSTGAHVLTFRTLPTSTDEVSVCYFSNASVIQALSGPNPGTLVGPEESKVERWAFGGNAATRLAFHSSTPTPEFYIYAGSEIENFYTAYQIPEFRHIPEELITVSPTTGTGLIGLQYKHIAVTADGGVIDSPTSLTLGNLLVSRSDQKVNGNTYSNSTTLTFVVGDAVSYTPGGPFNYVFVEDAANGYLDNKVLKIATGNISLSSNITVAMPSNAFQVTRTVSAISSDTGNANATITLTGNVDGVSQGANVLIVDGSNTTGLNGLVFVVENDPATGVLQIDSGAYTFLSNANVSYINYGNDATGNSNVQIFSALHGFPSNSNVIVSNSSNASIANATFTVRVSSNNTFFLTPNSAVTGALVGNASPVLLNTTLTTTSFTPVRSINLSSNTTLSTAIATVNAVSDWPEMNLVSGTTNRVFFTTKPAYTSSIGLDFRLHEDPAIPTLSVLSLTEGEYSKDTTVKAKLERWMNSLLESDNVPIFNTVLVGEEYTTTGNDSLLPYILDIDNTFDEITFGSREEARDFNKTVNTIFFERPDSTEPTNIKGLVNLKTNLELQVRSSIALGDKTVSYTDLNTAVISRSAANTSIDDLSISATNYKNYVIEYSISETADATLKYQRMGQLLVSARPDFNSGAGAVILQDFASEMLDTGLSGNVTFEAHIGASNTEINIHATNNLSPSIVDLDMQYIVRRW